MVVLVEVVAVVVTGNKVATNLRLCEESLWVGEEDGEGEQELGQETEEW